jgi:hypothetical protein
MLLFGKVWTFEHASADQDESIGTIIDIQSQTRSASTLTICAIGNGSLWFDLGGKE